MASMLKNNPRSGKNGSTVTLERRPSTAPKSTTSRLSALLLEELRRVAELQTQGHTEAHLEVESFTGTEREIAAAINGMTNNFVTVRGSVTSCLEGFAAGDLNAELKTWGLNSSLLEAIEGLRRNLKAFLAEMHRMSDEHNKGDLDVKIRSEKFSGDFRAMAEGVNEMVGGHIAVKKKAMACIAEFGRGNFDAPLERFAGKKAFINDTIEQLRANLKSFIAEMSRMSEEHTKGDIDVAIPSEKFAGDFRSMAEGVNEMVSGHIAVKKKAMACIAEFGQRQFRRAAGTLPGQESFH